MLEAKVLFFVATALDEQWSKFGSSATGQFMLGLSMQNGIYATCHGRNGLIYFLVVLFLWNMCDVGEFLVK